jgi:hypothetical protein
MAAADGGLKLRTSWYAATMGPEAGGVRNRKPPLLGGGGPPWKTAGDAGRRHNAQALLLNRASALSVTLRAVPHGPTALASMAVNAGTLMPVKPDRTGETAAATRAGSRAVTYRHCLAHSGPSAGRATPPEMDDLAACRPTYPAALLAVFTLGLLTQPAAPTPAPASNALPRPRRGPQQVGRQAARRLPCPPVQRPSRRQRWTVGRCD